MIRRLTVVLLSGVICLLLGLTSALAVEYNEAPMLKEKVAAGELPPVEERLPEEPLVVEVVEEIGQYGGTLHMLTPVPNDMDDCDTFNEQCVLRMSPGLTTIEPNIAKGWEFSEDAKTLTLFLRKGMKWSDGAPFTADDVMFWYEDVVLNDELTPVKPGDWSPGGELMKVEKIDDWTVQLRFAAPYAVATLMLAHSWGMPSSFFYPKHYLKQFHPNYVPMEKLKEMAEERGFDHWYELFRERSRHDSGVPLDNPDYPVVNPYYLKEKTPGYWSLERNPYFWAVDTEGNQLPYIDGILLTLVEDREMVASKVATGEVDWAAKETALKDYPLYMGNEEKGNFRVILWKSIFGGDCVYQFNQTYKKDLVLRDILRDLRFRQALSLAINREEINEALYFGKAVPRQWTVIPACSYYEEEFAESYAEYNPEEANRLLDEMGLDKRDEAGYRLKPDGKRLAFTIEYYPIESPKTPISEMVKEYWGAVGVQVSLKEISGELSAMRYPANEVAVGAWHGDVTTDILFPIFPWQYVPYALHWGTTFCPLWAQWYNTGGEEGEEPPQEVKNLYKWWESLKATTNEEERIELGKKILRSQAENLWCIGEVGCGPIPVIVRSNLRNVPEETYYGWDTLFGYYVHPEQFFFKQD